MSDPATPAPEATPAAPSSGNALFDALSAQLLGPSEPETPPAAPEAPPVETPPADPVKELEKNAPAPDEPKLPIDELEDEPEAEPTEKPDKVAHAMKELREEAKKWKAETEVERQAKAQLEARLVELEAAAKAKVELEKRIEDYEKEMSVVKLERTQKYQELVAEPSRKIAASLEKIAEKYDIDYDALADAVENQDDDASKAKLNDLLSGLQVNSMDVVDLANLRAAMKPIMQKREELYANADSALLELQARGEQETEAQALARAEERERMAPIIAAKVARLTPFFKDAIDAAAQGLKETDPSKLDVNAQLYNKLAGDAFPKVAKQFAALKKAHDELLEELAEYKSAKPGVGSFTSPSGGPPKDLAEALARGLGIG